MGKQISFVHSEIDASIFMHNIDNLDARIVIDGKYMSPKDSVGVVLDRMASNEYQFLIVPLSIPFIHTKKKRGECILDGVAVEFSNCWKRNFESHTYEAGRLYVSTWYSGDEQTVVLKLFEKLRKEIKKKYTYSSASRIYWGPDFLKHYNCGEYKATYTGKYITF